MNQLQAPLAPVEFTQAQVDEQFLQIADRAQAEALSATTFTPGVYGTRANVDPSLEAAARELPPVNAAIGVAVLRESSYVAPELQGVVARHHGFRVAALEAQIAQRQSLELFKDNNEADD